MVTKCCSAIYLPKRKQNVIGTADGSLAACSTSRFQATFCKFEKGAFVGSDDGLAGVAGRDRVARIPSPRVSALG
jgi:hypothetical protein